MTGLVALALLVGAGFLVLLASLKKVPPDRCWTVSRLGSYHRTLAPGWHLAVPLLDRVTHRINTTGQVLVVAGDHHRSRDGKRVSARGRLFFQVLDPRKAAYHSGDLLQGTEALAHGSCGELAAQLTMDSLNSRTERELNHWLLGMLNQTSLEWGVRVTRVELKFEAAADAGSADQLQPPDKSQA